MEEEEFSPARSNWDWKSVRSGLYGGEAMAPPAYSTRTLV